MNAKIDALQKLVMRAEEHIRASRGALDSFAESFAEDPARAFEWANDAFRAAGRDHAGKAVLNWIETVQKNRPGLDRDAVHEIVMTEISEEVVRRATYPERSTSVPSNEISACKNAALAEFLRRH